MKIRISLDDIDEKLTNELARILSDGGIAVLPTETVYGLFARFDDTDAVERIFEIKGREKTKVLSLTLSEAGRAGDYVRLASWQKKTLEYFLPGPITMVLESKLGDFSYLVEEGKTGIRIPDFQITLDILKACRIPLVSTSANLSGMSASGSFAEIDDSILSSVDFCVDAGDLPLKVPSTVYDLSFFPGRVIREGTIRSADIIQVAERFFREEKR